MPPNILLIHWHDTGRYLPAYGVPAIDTPALDRLATEGIVFERAYSTAPLCSPARSSLFTGRYPHSNGVMGLAHLGWEYHAEEVTLPMMLRQVGYTSALIGLQHESSDPRNLGFDEIHNLNAQEQYGDPVSALAAIFLKDRARAIEPFFLSVGIFEPHRPFSRALYGEADPGQVSVPGYLPDSPEVRQDLAEFCAAIEAADAATGEILQALDDAGLTEQTIVVFTTDHGIPFPGAKSTLYSSGIEVALMTRFPRGLVERQPGRVTGLLSHVDVAPTLVDLVGGEVPERVQGVSIAPWLRGEDAWGRTHVFAEKNWHDPDQYDPIRTVRDERYSYIRNWEDGPALSLSRDLATSLSAETEQVQQRAAGRRVPEELYDTLTDPDELDNRAEDPALADTRSRLAGVLDAWQRDTADPLLAGPIPRPRRAGTLQRHIVVNHEGVDQP